MAKWRGPRTTKDQTYSTKAWAKTKAHWIKLRLPTCQSPHCLLPGVPIDYTPPYTRDTSFSCGHIVAKWQAKQWGWTVEQMNSIQQTRPEHALCNRRHGAWMGQRRQAAKVRRRVVALDTSRRWRWITTPT